MKEKISCLIFDCDFDAFLLVVFLFDFIFYFLYFVLGFASTPRRDITPGVGITPGLLSLDHGVVVDLGEDQFLNASELADEVHRSPSIRSGNGDDLSRGFVLEFESENDLENIDPEQVEGGGNEESGIRNSGINVVF